MNKFYVVLSVIFYYLLNFKILILILNFSRFDVYIDVYVVLNFFLRNIFFIW